MVASWYSSSTGCVVRPRRTSSAGNTPDSRSRIIQPSVRTVSLTQNGIRHTTNSSALMRPRASLAMVHAIGNATSNVRTVASADMSAVLTNTCQYNGSLKNVRYWARLTAYARGATRSRNDNSARSTCGSTISANSHSSAGASKSPSIRRRYQSVAARVSGMAVGSRETDGPLRIETEIDARAGLQVRIGPGLRQRNAELDTTLQFAQQHGGVGTVEQQADHLAGVRRLASQAVVGADKSGDEWACR